MINEAITAKDQKIIDEIVKDTKALGIPDSFIQELVLFSQKVAQDAPALAPPTPPSPTKVTAPSPAPSSSASFGGVKQPPPPLASSQPPASGNNNSNPSSFIPLPLPLSHQKQSLSSNASKSSATTVWKQNSISSPPPSHRIATATTVKTPSHSGSNTNNYTFRKMNRQMFTPEDLELFEKVVMLSSSSSEDEKSLGGVAEDKVIRILCRTGRFNENGFPCHGCLNLFATVPSSSSSSTSYYSKQQLGSEGIGGEASRRTAKRCDECLKTKTKEEWDAISWNRFEWYTQTKDGKLAADIFRSLVAGCGGGGGGGGDESSSSPSSALISKLYDKVISTLVERVVKVVMKEKNQSLLIEKIISSLEEQI